MDTLDLGINVKYGMVCVDKLCTAHGGARVVNDLRSLFLVLRIHA